MRRWLLVLSLLSLPVTARAQQGAPAARDVAAAEAEAEAAQGPQAAPRAVTTATGTMPAGHPPTSGPGAVRSPFDAPPIASAEPSSAVPAGAVRVTVIDERGLPVPGATVVLGTMGQGGERTRVSAVTDANGQHVWADLPSGTSQAYRVNVPFEGATYSCTPFQLPNDQGYDVRVMRLPVTTDERNVLMLLGQTFVEVRDERLHIIQQVQLANISQRAETYVFPEGGLRVPLPEGFLAFQTQPVMTDQHVEALADYGMLVRGSLPPGRVTLMWAFDLPITGANMDVRLEVPFRTYVYRVIADAPEGMTASATGLPELRPFEDRGRPLYGTELTRRPEDPPFEAYTLHLRGIPGPGPLRWIAVALALGLLGFGVVGAVRAGSPEKAAAAARNRRKKALLDEAAALEAEFAAGEIGPEYRQTRHDAIVRELAVLLHQESPPPS